MNTDSFSEQLFDERLEWTIDWELESREGDGCSG
jgi:hypothetical protein